MVVFGAVLITTMVFFPQGVVPTVSRWVRRWKP
jgi:ABC-type branched-subunit amino acid transport system permease subunit